MKHILFVFVIILSISVFLRRFTLENFLQKEKHNNLLTKTKKLLKKYKDTLNINEKAYIWHWWKANDTVNKIPYNTLLTSLFHFQTWNVMINFEDNITNTYYISDVVKRLQRTIDTWFNFSSLINIRVNVVAVRYKSSIESKIKDLSTYQINPNVVVLKVGDEAPNFKEEGLWKYYTFYKGERIPNKRDRYNSPSELENYEKFYHSVISLSGWDTYGYYIAHATPHYMRFFEQPSDNRSSITDQSIVDHEFGHCIGLSDLYDHVDFPESITIELSDPLYVNRRKNKKLPKQRTIVTAYKYKIKSIMYERSYSVTNMDKMMIYKMLFA